MLDVSQRKGDRLVRVVPSEHGGAVVPSDADHEALATFLLSCTQALDELLHHQVHGLYISNLQSVGRGNDFTSHLCKAGGSAMQMIESEHSAMYVFACVAQRGRIRGSDYCRGACLHHRLSVVTSVINSLDMQEAKIILPRGQCPGNNLSLHV